MATVGASSPHPQLVSLRMRAASRPYHVHVSQEGGGGRHSYRPMRYAYVYALYAAQDSCVLVMGQSTPVAVRLFRGARSERGYDVIVNRSPNV